MSSNNRTNQSTTMSQSNQSPSQTTENAKNNKAISFSKVVSYSLFPKKTQAIVIDTVNDTDVKTYLKPMASKTVSTNIIAASKIAQNRFCCYFNDEKIVDELTKEGNSDIIINGEKLEIRPYVTKAKRVIFSNVHSCIPHDEIIAKLKDYNITPKSNMSFIRLGFDEPGFTQVLSFRRQLFIEPDDVNKLPSDFTINFDDTVYHIYVSADKITCFTCHKEGHTAKYCPTLKDKYMENSYTQHIVNTQTLQSEQKQEEEISTVDTQGTQNSDNSNDEKARENGSPAWEFQGTNYSKSQLLLKTLKRKEDSGRPAHPRHLSI